MNQTTLQLMQDNWIFLVSLMFGTGVASSLIAGAVAHWRNKKSQKQEATYLVLRIAVLLEKFALDCSNAIASNDMERQSSGNRAYSSKSIPELPEYPNDPAWRLIDTSLSASLLALPNQITMAHGSVSHVSDVGDFEDVSLECDKQTGKCGYIAWSLAKALRKRHSLPPFNPTWDIVACFMPLHDKAITEEYTNMSPIQLEGLLSTKRIWSRYPSAVEDSQHLGS